MELGISFEAAQSEFGRRGGKRGGLVHAMQKSDRSTFLQDYDEAEQEVEDALGGSSTKAGKVAALRALPKISSLLEGINSLTIGGKSNTFKYIPSGHWQGAPSSQRMSVNPADLKESMKAALDALLIAMDTDSIFGEMSWREIKVELLLVLGE